MYVSKIVSGSKVDLLVHVYINIYINLCLFDEYGNDSHLICQILSQSAKHISDLVKQIVHETKKVYYTIHISEEVFQEAR